MAIVVVVIAGIVFFLVIAISFVFFMLESGKDIVILKKRILAGTGGSGDDRVEAIPSAKQEKHYGGTSTDISATTGKVS